MKSIYITPQIFIEEIDDHLLQTLSRTGPEVINAATDNKNQYGYGLNGSNPDTGQEDWADSKGTFFNWDFDEE